MNTHPMTSASIPNPAINHFRVLVGNWITSGSHPLDPDMIVQGRTSFEWLENGAFLMQRTEIDDDRFPNAIAIFGSDDLLEEFYMLYFDERGVSRKYEVTLQDNILKLWRNAPGFSQRFTGTFSEDGNTMVGVWELSRDDSTWEKDFELTYKRAE